MYISKAFIPILKNNPSEAKIKSHQLMLRVGMIKQSSAGIYSWLPLGFKVMKKIEKELNSNNSDSEFFRNCRDVVANHVITPPSSWKLKPKIWNYQLGFLASLVNNVIKEEKTPPKENLSHLGWIGTEKKRGNFFVKLIEYIEAYGIHKVVDKTGNRGIFFSFSGTDKIAKGDCFLMKATPSRHQINKYDGGKETYFNRVIIEENKGGT